MNTEKCKLLLQVLQAGSFSAAAEHLGYTPSGVMRAITSLEKEIGFPLLGRTAQGVHLTREGKEILPYLRQLVRDQETIMQYSAQLRGLTAGDIYIGSYFSVAANWLPGIIHSFQQDYPAVHVHIEECANKEMYKGLEEGRFDCCITTWRPFSGDWIPLCDDEMVMWLPADHPLAKAEAYPLSELEHDSFIEPLPHQDTDVVKILKEEGISYETRYTAIDNYTTYRMVEAGLGVSMNNRLMTAQWQGRVAIVPIEPKHTITIGIAIPNRKAAAPAVKKFIHYVKKEVTEA
ncbi:LysR family transcriptional regulator [Megasphaera sp.]|uniref:LysR family transcriptional regulator n=1 Tax=Megasphaera sp. TaxID=2023260 RepID=UPI00351FA715